MTAEAKVPCELCAEPTPMLGTKRCDRCYELEWRVKRDPEIAVRILEKLRTAIETKS